MTARQLAVDLLLLVLGSASMVAAAGGSRPMATVRSTYGITAFNICSPDDYIVLIRRADHRVIALAFHAIEKGAEENTGTAEYSVFLLDDQSPPRAERGEVSVLGWSGFRPLTVTKGRNSIRQFGFRLRYRYPSCVDMYGTPYEFAPTPWTRVEDVDVKALCLRWYRGRENNDFSIEVAPSELTHSPESRDRSN